MCNNFITDKWQLNVYKQQHLNKSIFIMVNDENSHFQNLKPITYWLVLLSHFKVRESYVKLHIPISLRSTLETTGWTTNTYVSFSN